MVIPEKLLVAFWEMDRKMDAERMSKQTYPTDLTEICDLKYKKDGHKYHKLDVYYPEKTKKSAKLPVIIDIHGGGWFYGDKELNKNYCLHLAQRGFVVFDISYRLVPEVHFKEQLADCMDALCYIGKHMDKYPCDKKRVYVTGDSAGGQLAAYVGAATVSERMRKAFDLPKPDFEIKALGLVSPVPDLTPKGVMRLYTPHVLGKKYKKQPWAKYVDFKKTVRSTKGEFPPTIIFSSLADVVASSQSKAAYKYLKSRGIKVKLNYAYAPKLGHVYQVLEPDWKESQKAISEMVKFFNKNK